MMLQRSRLPAVLMLLAVIAFGSGMVLARRGNANAMQDDLLRLQAAAAAPAACPEVWVKYAQALQATGRLPDAILAYNQALQLNTYDRDALLGCASCHARLGNSQAFFEFMEATNKVDPKTSVAIFTRPEASAYLSEPRFQTLKAIADAGAMD